MKYRNHDLESLRCIAVDLDEAQEAVVKHDPKKADEYRKEMGEVQAEINRRGYRFKRGSWDLEQTPAESPLSPMLARVVSRGG